MSSTMVSLRDCKFEVLTEGDQFLGLGRIWIGDTQVRAGTLPLDVVTQTFTGLELAGLTLAEIVKTRSAVRLRLQAFFRPLLTKLMRDHSIDPIHDTGDWDRPRVAGTANLDLVLEPAKDEFGGVAFAGFSYHYEYESLDTPIFWLLDRASWELGGDIAGATVYSQSSCSAPAATFAKDTFWTTEGELFFLDPAAHFNRCMTHNLPRWASHQSFDFQFHGNAVLLGVFERVELIRSVLRRDAGKAELKTFDKHIFDETTAYSTARKAILINAEAKSATDIKNIWTWVFDAVHARARAEFGLKEQPPVPLTGHHYWANRTIDTYYKDIVPATAAIGLRGIFTENFKRSDVTEPGRLHNGNMCGPHELEIAPEAGGMPKFKEYIERCHKAGIQNFMWSCIHVSVAAKMNLDHRVEAGKSWYIAMEDTRTKYGGAYTNVLNNLNLNNPAAWEYWVESHRKIAAESGLDGYFLDSFYNLFFMPVDYCSGHPKTVWRSGLRALKSLQDSGIGWYIESFGPFGQPQHGHPAEYNPANIHLCYYVGMGNGYTTVPVPGTVSTENIGHQPQYLFWQLAHKSPIGVPLFIEGKRVDEVYLDEHRRVIREYHERLPQMHRRYLQPDGLGVLWHDAAGKVATLFNFKARTVALPGKVTDLSTGKILPKAKAYKLAATHTYAVTGVKTLPTAV